MEGSSSTSHFRSISLLSRFTHPSCTEIEKRINELKGPGNLAGLSQNIQSGLVGLSELYVYVDKLVRSPHTQEALSNQKSRSLVEDVLEGSIGLLDSCSVLKDLTMLMKENIQLFQSALRRKGGDPTIASRQIATYQCFRKRFKKSVIMSLETLTHLEKKMGLFLYLNVDQHVLMVSKVLGKVYALAISIFKSFLVFMSSKPKATNGVQFLSKLVSRTGSTRVKNETFINEVDAVDMATTLLLKSVRKNEIKNADIQITLTTLKILDVSIDGFEAGLEFLFRRLVQSRASLLNIVVC